MNERMKELVAMGASAAANCHPCMDYHLAQCDRLGIDREEVAAAVAVGLTVNHGAEKAIRKKSRDHLRKVNEERVAASYAPWRAVTAPFRGLMEALRRARYERETYRELSRFSDCMLKDIGISRSEIGSIAQAVAVAEAGMTIAELRQIQRTAPAGRGPAPTSGGARPVADRIPTLTPATERRDWG